MKTTKMLHPGATFYFGDQLLKVMPDDWREDDRVRAGADAIGCLSVTTGAEYQISRKEVMRRLRQVAFD